MSLQTPRLIIVETGACSLLWKGALAFLIPLHQLGSSLRASQLTREVQQRSHVKMNTATLANLQLGWSCEESKTDTVHPVGGPWGLARGVAVASLICNAT